MKKQFYRLCSLVLFGFVMFSYGVVLAQEVVNTDDIQLTPGVPPTPEQIEKIKNAPRIVLDYISKLSSKGLSEGSLGDCSVVYKFGNIKINLTQDQPQYQPGDIIGLSGTINNDNAYPLNDVTIAARLVKNIPNSNDQAFTTTIDEFIVVEDLTLPAKGNVDVKKTYDLGVSAPQGDYQILFFAYQYDRFSLSGLEFSDDVFAYRVTFGVGGANREQVYLDQTRTMVNDQKHINHGFLTTHKSNEPIRVRIPLKNNTNQEQKMTLTSQIYSWDALRSEQLLKEEKEDITIPANGEIMITRTVEKAELPIYYLKLSATQAGDVVSAQRYETISNIRFATDEGKLPRFNWVGLNQFPEAGAQVFTCVHNTSGLIVNNIQVETKVLDESGKQIAKSSYKGSITGQIDGIIADLPKNRRDNQLTIIATMSDESGKVIDEVTIPYNCSNIPGATCNAMSVNSSSGRLLLGVIGGIFILVIVGLGVYFIQKREEIRLAKKK